MLERCGYARRYEEWDEGVKGWMLGRNGCVRRCKGLDAERKVCAEMCEGWRKGRKEWGLDVVSGGDGVKE